MARRASAPIDRDSNSDVTGSVPAHRAPPPPPPPPKPAGAWTWDGGSPVTVGYGESVETIARKHGVPASAILQTNGITNPASIKPGQRLVIPRYVSASVASAQAPAAPPASPTTAAENVHIVLPGESMIGIARRHGVALSALARANNIQPYTKINIGDRLVVPGGRRLAARSAPTPYVGAAAHGSSRESMPPPRRSGRVAPRRSRIAPRPSSRPRKWLAPCRHSAGR